jgi:putative phosphoribosyl transferase
MLRFKDRVDAGKKLAQKLLSYQSDPTVMVVGLPRGGVVVAYEVAHLLQVPLDIIVPRKIGMPANPELALGAITQEGEPVWNEALIKSFHIHKEDLKDILEQEKREAARRLSLYRKSHLAQDFKNKTVILIDDGIATGATMRAAIAGIRAQGAKKIIVAVPVAPLEILEEIEKEADEIICLAVPRMFYGVGQFYDSFAQTTDEEVIALMQNK